jgi:hypothetical protein
MCRKVKVVEPRLSVSTVSRDSDTNSFTMTTTCNFFDIYIAFFLELE